MANTIKIKRNVTNNDAATINDIARGELGFTEATETLFYRDAGDNIRTIGGGGAFLRKNTNDTFTGDLTVSGNLSVSGTTTTIDSTNVAIEDPQFELARNNNNDGSNGVVTDSVDFGTYGSYNKAPGAANTTAYAGWFRDASDSGKIKWYSNLEAEPGTTVNDGHASFVGATLVARTFEGNLSGSPEITAGKVVTSFDMDGAELILDLDGDTSITADTDDQIDIKIGGADELRITNLETFPDVDGGHSLGKQNKQFHMIFTQGIDASSNVRAATFTSDISQGTAPFTVTSNTLVSNLNADLLRGKAGPTGDIVGTSDTQTLTAKTLTSPVLTTPQINDASSDHQYVFAASELTADRTVTLPVLDGNDEFVFKAASQTLTNKIIDGGTY